jgi:hypothetical protein
VGVALLNLHDGSGGDEAKGSDSSEDGLESEHCNGFLAFLVGMWWVRKVGLVNESNETDDALSAHLATRYIPLRVPHVDFLRFNCVHTHCAEGVRLPNEGPAPRPPKVQGSFNICHVVNLFRARAVIGDRYEGFKKKEDWGSSGVAA